MESEYVEGIVVYTRIHTSYLSGHSTGIGHKYGIVKIRTQGGQFIEIRFKGYTGFITISKHHRIRAYGRYLTKHIFKAEKIENLTTGEYWTFMSPLAFDALLGAMAVFIVTFISFRLFAKILEISFFIFEPLPSLFFTLVITIIAYQIFFHVKISESYKILE